jgi:AraC-like DNA-binding protein
VSRKKTRSRFFSLLKRIVKPIFTLLPLSLLTIPVYDLADTSFIIFPGERTKGNISAYTDRGFKGKSVIDHFSYKDGIFDLRYTLEKGANNPMVFTIQTLGTPAEPFDASSYKSVSIRVREGTTDCILIFMKTYVPGITQSGENFAYTLRHNQYSLEIRPGIHEYTIGFDSFSTREWWIDNMHLADSKLPKEKYERLISFDMQFNIGNSDSMIGYPQKIIIDKISFNKRFGLIDGLILVLLASFYSGLGIFAFARGIRESRSSLPRKSVEIPSYRERDLARIKEFIEHHYSDPDISTNVISESTGIAPERIFELVSDEYGLTFKQLINKMRIEEAKRLLQESDLRVTDIAMNLGFNDLSYFNRIFKRYAKVPPSRFRDKTF